MNAQMSFFDDVSPMGDTEPLRPELERFVALARYFHWLSKHDPHLYARVLRSPRPLHLVPDGRAA